MHESPAIRPAARTRLARRHRSLRGVATGRMRSALALLGVVAIAASLPLLAPTAAGADAPNFVSSSGITVTATRWITARTLEADISTSLVAANSINGPHRIRVTLPTAYAANPTARYPVLYLLHGGAGGNSAQWTTGGGAAEQITQGKPVITVMADGGKVGWFTNWVNQSKGVQRWADFYETQLIPWVDANLRTVAAKDGRAIAGLSMGGYGAVRIAQDRPDLFASVASFSGAVDLGDMGTRSVVTEQAIESGFPSDGPFGNPFWPNDTVWNQQDPMKRPTRLKGLQVLLYAGAGNSDADVIERTMGQSADRFSKTLTANGVPNFWWMYGRPGPSAPFGCDGGHNFGCWNFALNDALPRILTVLRVPAGTIPPPPPPPPAGTELTANGGFEASSLAPWACSGQCGQDRGAGIARTGANNGWVRNTSGWNDVHQTIAVQQNKTYRITAWLRTSANNKDGYFGMRTSGGQVIGEQKFGSFPGYTQITVTVNSGANTSLVAYAGTWANGDTWVQLDDVSVIQV